jgi:hypothetical protein
MQIVTAKAGPTTEHLAIAALSGAALEAHFFDGRATPVGSNDRPLGRVTSFGLQSKRHRKEPLSAGSAAINDTLMLKSAPLRGAAAAASALLATSA